MLWVRHLASHRQAIAAVISCAVLLPHLGRRRLSGALRPSPTGSCINLGTKRNPQSLRTEGFGVKPLAMTYSRMA